MSIFKDLFGGGQKVVKPQPPPTIADAENGAPRKAAGLQNRQGFLSTVLNRGRQTSPYGQTGNQGGSQTIG